MPFNRLFVPLLALMLLTACASAPETDTPVTTVEPNVIAVEVPLFPTRDFIPTEEVTPEATESEPPAPELLAWINIEASEGDHAGGQVALIDAEGAINPLLELTNNDFLVMPCGQADNRFAFYAGGETGRLYVMNGTQLSAPIATPYNLACFDGGTFQFSPDGSRFGYMDYRAEAFTKEYSDGVLHLHDSETTGEIASFDDVITYTLNDDRAVYVRFYQNALGEGSEAAINVWDGVENREIITLMPTGENCRFTSAAITVRGDLGVMALGQRCINQGTDWQLYTVDLAGRSATLAASGNSGGAYFSYARTNNVWLSPNGTYAYLTVPDGVTSRTAGLYAVNLNDFTVTRVIERQILLPHHDDVRKLTQLSLDGAWLALAITSPGNNRNGLVAVELDDPAFPLTIDLELNTVGGFAFTGDQLFYTEVSRNGNGSLSALDLTVGTPSRVARGFFQDGLILAPDNQSVGAQLYAGDSPYYSDLVAVTVSEGEMSTLYSGDGEGEAINRAHALAWR